MSLPRSWSRGSGPTGRAPSSTPRAVPSPLRPGRCSSGLRRPRGALEALHSPAMSSVLRWRGAAARRRRRRRRRRRGGLEKEEEEDAVVEMVDAPALPEPGILTRSDVEAAVCGSPGNPPPDCVILVLRCGGPSKGSRVAVKKLADIATVVRERGLQFVVVLTHKKHIKSMRQAEELRREIALRARTDCVYFIENYAAGNMLHLRRPWTSKNNFETHFTVLTMLRQCIEFTKLHRSNLARKANDNASSSRLP
ncbi:unnamed protein product [Musa textilis]